MQKALLTVAGKLLSLRHYLKSGVSGQAQHNAFAMAQHEREIRLRKNLDQLERLRCENENEPRS